MCMALNKCSLKPRPLSPFGVCHSSHFLPQGEVLSHCFHSVQILVCTSLLFSPFMCYIMYGLYTVHGLNVSHKTTSLKSFCIVVTNQVLSVSGSCVVKSSFYCRVLWSLSTMFYWCGETSALVIYPIVLTKQAVS